MDWIGFVCSSVGSVTLFSSRTFAPWASGDVSRHNAPMILGNHFEMDSPHCVVMWFYTDTLLHSFRSLYELCIVETIVEGSMWKWHTCWGSPRQLHEAKSLGSESGWDLASCSLVVPPSKRGVMLNNATLCKWCLWWDCEHCRPNHRAMGRFYYFVCIN